MVQFTTDKLIMLLCSQSVIIERPIFTPYWRTYPLADQAASAASCLNRSKKEEEKRLG